MTTATKGPPASPDKDPTISAEQERLEKLPDDSLRYFQCDSGIFEIRTVKTPAGPTQTKFQLAAFTARIVADLMLDNGAELSRRYEIEAKLGNTTKRFTVAAQEFTKVSDWAQRELGSKATVTAVPLAAAKVAEAIQRDSNPKTRTVYTHTGWREIGAEWVYLTAAGALGVDGLKTSVEVELVPPLDRYSLSGDGDVAAGVRASLSILDLAPDHVTVPLMGAVWRAPLGPTDFVPSLIGRTGAGKSVLAALAQQHWGPKLDARGLPGSWNSTAVSLESLVFETKDALVVIDDYAPGAGVDNRRLASTAESVIRSVGNGSTRGRGQVDGTRRAPRFPRGTVMITGEDYPKGASVVGRMFNSEVKPTDLEWSACTPVQKLAAEGVLAAGMSGFIRWLAGDYSAHQAWLANKVVSIRDELGKMGHTRTPACVGDLLAAWELWCQWATSLHYIDMSEANALLARVKTALLALGEQQKGIHQEVDPCQRFLETLTAVLASGSAHVAGVDGSVPDNAGQWGWRMDSLDATVMRCLGTRIGWVCPDGLYLEPVAALSAVQEMARKSGDRFEWSKETMCKRLAEGGHLASTDLESRGVVKVRKMVEGRRLYVLHLPADTLGESVIDSQLNLLTAVPELDEDTSSSATSSALKAAIDGDVPF